MILFQRQRYRRYSLFSIFFICLTHLHFSSYRYGSCYVASVLWSIPKSTPNALWSSCLCCAYYANHSLIFTCWCARATNPVIEVRWVYKEFESENWKKKYHPFRIRSTRAIYNYIGLRKYVSYKAFWNLISTVKKIYTTAMTISIKFETSLKMYIYRSYYKIFTIKIYSIKNWNSMNSSHLKYISVKYSSTEY